MKARIFNLWDAFRGGFWFIPTLFVVAAVALAFLLPQLDARFASQMSEHAPGLRMQGDTARSTVSSIASAMITVTGVVFSITLVALSIASSQFGSRLLRVFMSDHVTHVTIGYLVGGSVYCFFLLTSIHSSERFEGVPHISVGVGALVGISGFGVLIYFIHHVAQSIQVTTIVDALAADLDDSIQRLFPHTVDAPADETDEAADGSYVFDEENAVTVASDREGYIQAIDVEGLIAYAADHDLVVRLRYRPGHYLMDRAPVADVVPESDAPEEVARGINDAVLVGNRRTPRQDVECAVHELVEVAVRALSPGINDPFTAISCIDRLGSSLARLARRRIQPPVRHDRKGDVRLIVPQTTFEDVFDSAFHPIRQYSTSSISVVIRLLDSIVQIARFATAPEKAAVLRRHTQLIMESATSSSPHPADLETIDNHYRRALAATERGAATMADPHESRTVSN